MLEISLSSLLWTPFGGQRICKNKKLCQHLICKFLSHHLSYSYHHLVVQVFSPTTPDTTGMAQTVTLPGPVTVEKRFSFALSRRVRGVTVFLCLFFLAVLAVLALLFHLHYGSHDPLKIFHGLPTPEGGSESNPPLFLEWYEREKRLPQHDPNLPYPQGREGRYVRFANQGTGAVVYFLAGHLI